MSNSLRKLKSNRENAKKSTGPTSPEGREKVSQNRTVHGLTGKFRVLEGEDQEKFDALLDHYMLDEKPVGIAEIELVKKMVEHIWLSERASRFQEACFLVMDRAPEQLENVEAEIRVRPELERYMRYQAHHDRAYQRASNELLRHRKERLKAEFGFELQKRAEREEQRRDRKEDRDIEIHKIATATAQKRFELVEVKVFNATAAAAQRLGAIERRQNTKIAA
jgi:hypothetical protein